MASSDHDHETDLHVPMGPCGCPDASLCTAIFHDLSLQTVLVHSDTTPRLYKVPVFPLTHTASCKACDCAEDDEMAECTCGAQKEAAVAATGEKPPTPLSPKTRAPLGADLLQWQEQVNVVLRENNLGIARRGKKCATAYNSILRKSQAQFTRLTSLSAALTAEFNPSREWKPKLKAEMRKVSGDSKITKSGKSPADEKSEESSVLTSPKKGKADTSDTAVESSMTKSPSRIPQPTVGSSEESAIAPMSDAPVLVSNMTHTLNRMQTAIQLISTRIGILQGVLEESLAATHQFKMEEMRDDHAFGIDRVQEFWKSELEQKRDEDKMTVEESKAKEAAVEEMGFHSVSVAPVTEHLEETKEESSEDWRQNADGNIPAALAEGFKGISVQRPSEDGTINIDS